MATSPSYAAPRVLLMPKALSITGLAISVILFVLFTWDLLAPAWMAPFRRASLLMNISFIFCSLILAYLSWTTWKEQV